ncbi:YihY/virulence factor BrkB family protein [Granulicella arctica]|uniref:YihY/virulence factor BrkB family protein n=1 Tax=Granulicella arctica TaxID=940613 RepID=UPI0021E028E0|nr:YihY/virulence factor BrkB family protein [Granulicella arctica]
MGTSNDDLDYAAHHRQQKIWGYVSLKPLYSLWDLKGMPLSVLAKRTMNSFLDDNLLGRAAELGYYFLFALFPTLVSASSILGLAAKSATTIYVHLLHYFALIIPPSAYNIVLDTFNQTTASSTSGKLTFGLAAAVWAASVGFTAIQDSLNVVYKVKETRPYWKVRGSAILITILLSFIVTLILASLLGGDFLAVLAHNHIVQARLAMPIVIFARIVGWTIATILLALLFAVIYYWGPDVRNKQWRWFTPGALFGIICWLLSSFALRVYLHFFNNYSVTYGSLGAVIILLTWFYITGLMLLLGAEMNSEIEAYAAERHLATSPAQLVAGLATEMARVTPAYSVSAPTSPGSL